MKERILGLGRFSFLIGAFEKKKCPAMAVMSSGFLSKYRNFL